MSSPLQICIHLKTEISKSLDMENATISHFVLASMSLSNSMLSQMNTQSLLSLMVTQILFSVKLYNIQDVTDMYVVSHRVQLYEWGKLTYVRWE